MLVLVRVVTNDDWAGLVGDLAVKPPHCDVNAGTCGQNYFITTGWNHSNAQFVAAWLRNFTFQVNHLKLLP